MGLLYIIFSHTNKKGDPRVATWEDNAVWFLCYLMHDLPGFLHPVICLCALLETALLLIDIWNRVDSSVCAPKRYCILSFNYTLKGSSIWVGNIHISYISVEKYILAVDRRGSFFHVISVFCVICSMLHGISDWYLKRICLLVKVFNGGLTD